MTVTARVASLIFNQPLLVLPETAATIAAALADRFGIDLGDNGSAIVGHAGAVDASRFVGRPVETRLGDGSTRTAYRNEDGIALINVHGELVNRGAYVGAVSGLTSYEGLDASLRAARDDSSVRAIVLDMNSPGGAAAGAIETAELVRKISQEKPVVAFVNALAASAAYAIASGASHIIATPSATLGSIGVVWMHLDRSAQLDKSGLKPTLLTAGAYKADGHPFASLPDDARLRIQSQIDAVYSLFIKAVATHRGMSTENVRKTEAGVFMGRTAVDAGLADEIGGLDDVFAFLNRDRHANKSAFGRPSLGGSMSKPEGATGAEIPVMTEAQHAAALNTALDAARLESASAASAETREEICAALEGLFQGNARAETFVEALRDGANVALAAKFAAKIEDPKALIAGPRLGAVVPRPEVQPDPAASGPSSEKDAHISALQAAVPAHLRRKSA